MAAHTLILPGDGTDFAHWRQLARGLWAQQVPPEEVVWLTEDLQARSPDLFAMPEAAPQAASLAALAATPERALTVPRAWLAEAEQCLLNSDPDRFALLYRLLWRMQHEPALRHDLLDADQVQMQHWIKAVRREVHKAHAFVRFRPVALADDPADGSGPLYVAWFEPVHHIVHAAAPFFVKRFANMRWAILTPQCSLRWWPQAPDVAALAAQGVQPEAALQPLRGRAGVLSWGPGASAQDAPDADAGENLWLTYYAHIFNPARLKVAAMYKEMPRKYWHNLPETQLISPMIQAAQARSAAMLANAPTTPRRRLPQQGPAVQDPG
ncbi:TIGR03915 family putative DNA repair protein [Comamonas antarctica]|uniref:TIGR03915 family putative DNA repair protein n=1 Tax=Comamonas antarctica TaxID=2743470 RepID=A0A6N1X7Q9_9BURK|nr:TIGR03915 family putative DNA repair protein [Comamonas antarctica]QKV54152.1 TIGR03915 family putative DNA repair protein [Comamonas antarctica]